MVTSPLLIRGFGVRVPGGAPVIMALTSQYVVEQSGVLRVVQDVDHGGAVRLKP